MLAPRLERVFFNSRCVSPAQGPLEISDITPENCSLSWRPPADDGGSPITNYVIEKMDVSSDVSNHLLVLYASFVKFAIDL